MPDRALQAGDVYRVVTPFRTFASVTYEPGDQLEIIERTDEAPHGRRSSLGNLRVRCKHFESVWTCFEPMILDGSVVLVKPETENGHVV